MFSLVSILSDGWFIRVPNSSVGLAVTPSIKPNLPADRRVGPRLLTGTDLVRSPPNLTRPDPCSAKTARVSIWTDVDPLRPAPQSVERVNVVGPLPGSLSNYTV